MKRWRQRPSNNCTGAQGNTAPHFHMPPINPNPSIPDYAISRPLTTAANPCRAVPHRDDYGIVNTINTSLRVDPDAILIGEQTLSAILQNLQEQVALLVPSIELHHEYAELRELYEQYQKKRNEIMEKRRMWEELKK